jgi:DNA-binding response OmpR family regulator
VAEPGLAVAGAVILVEEPIHPWVAAIERMLSERRFRIARVRELAMVPYLLLAGGVSALFLSGRRLGRSDLDTLQKCRKLAPTLRVIVIAARGAAGDMKHALESGATAWLEWPADEAVVLEALRDGGSTAAPRRAVVLYTGWSDPTIAHRDALQEAGFEVHVVTTFQDASAWLLAYGGHAVLLLYVAPIESVRKSVLQALRRLQTKLPVVAMIRQDTPEVRDDLRRAGIDRILSTSDPAATVVDAVRGARE